MKSSRRGSIGRHLDGVSLNVRWLERQVDEAFVNVQRAFKAQRQSLVKELALTQSFERGR